MTQAALKCHDAQHTSKICTRTRMSIVSRRSKVHRSLVERQRGPQSASPALLQSLASQRRRIARTFCVFIRASRKPSGSKIQMNASQAVSTASVPNINMLLLQSSVHRGWLASFARAPRNLGETPWMKVESPDGTQPPGLPASVQAPRAKLKPSDVCDHSLNVGLKLGESSGASRPTRKWTLRCAHSGLASALSDSR